MSNQPSQLVTTPATPPALATGASGAIEQQQYLTFSLGEEMFAIGILAIREIIEYGALTEVPMVPPFIRGVINLRGSVVPVIDMAVRFGRPASEVTKRTCIVILETSDGGQTEGHGQQMGIVVDAVSEVLEIPPEEIEPPPQFGARIRIDFISGMGKVNGKFVVLLEVNRILSLGEVAVLANLARQEAGAS
ncbi:chemotaxis protein CheW [Dechloromonas denitrificans]|uniref:chemotaxis protein CheW n=1 Tax=Dechloromonas denitrificans TaxID=281362 RepID=UPI001CFC4673|nr:chemotaxis protein CheW [Dechloromonas denitrificans]UCV09367.1 purine-binding chemotaxis protein CheW [Dechloromonas denitrificans]